jgi:hypothetical protein
MLAIFIEKMYWLEMSKIAFKHAANFCIFNSIFGFSSLLAFLNGLVNDFVLKNDVIVEV